jgi:hypothetical protein
VWSLNTDFAVNAHVMNVIIQGDDFPERREEMSLENGRGTFSVPVGNDRTFYIEVLNQSGALVYQSPQQTVDVTTGNALEIEVVLDPVELHVPVVSVSQSDPGQELVVAIDDTTSPLQGLRVTVPANAASQPLTVSVTEVYNPTDITTPGNQAGVILDLNPSGVNFASPVTVEFPYSDPLVTALGIDETSLRVSRFEPATQQWNPLPNQSVDTERDLIVVHLEHFSFYVITYGARRDPAPTVDHNPVVTNPGPQATAMNVAVSLVITATEADDDSLTYSATGLPAGLEIDPHTGQITGIVAPSAAEHSPYTVTITVSNDTGSTTAIFPWVVTSAPPVDPPPTAQTNHPPVLTTLAAQSSVEGQEVSLAVQASDADGDILWFSATGLPSGVTLHTTTGRLGGTIANTAGATSPYTVEIMAFDGTHTARTSFAWTITNPEPVITWPGNQTHTDGAPVSLQVNATDADQDSLTYTATNLPPGVSMNAATGRISGVLTTAASARSPYLVTIRVADGAATSTISFTWTVEPASEPILLASWTPPTTNEDGSPLVDLAKYRLYYGRSSRGSATEPSAFTYDVTVDIHDAGATSYSMPVPTPAGRYYFSLTAIDTSGNESVFSEEVSLDIP